MNNEKKESRDARIQSLVDLLMGGKVRLVQIVTMARDLFCEVRKIYLSLIGSSKVNTVAN